MAKQMITIEGETVSATSPEGKIARMPLVTFLDKARPRVISTGQDIVPDGVKAIRTIENLTVVVHESPPAVYNLKWITADSPAPFGRSAKYRNVRVALPYMLILASFRQAGDKRMMTHGNECFFRTEPLKSMDDLLYAPGLLNCSKFPDKNMEGRHLAWICTQHLDLSGVHDSAQPMREGIKALMQCLIGTGFNRSSEMHEGSSWYNETRKVDERISTVEKWEEATIKDPLFALDVDWIPTKLSLEKMIKRMAGLHGIKASAPTNASQLAKHIFNH